MPNGRGFDQSAQSMVGQAYNEILALIHDGSDFRSARQLIRRGLTSAEGRTKSRRRRLLDLLVIVEISTGRRKAAIMALSERQSLGFQSFFCAFDAALLKGSLFAQNGQFDAAREEIAPFVANPSSIRHPSLLSALELYIQDYQTCGPDMEAPLVRGLNSVIKRFGVPIKTVISRESVCALVREAHAKFSAANKRHTAFTLQALEARSPEARAAVVERIEANLSGENVKYFKRAARRLIVRLRGA